MFERWTDRARRSVALARDCARALGHAEVGTGHMLAGLYAEGGGVAFLALSALGWDGNEVPRALERRCPRAAGGSPPNIPFSPRGKRACELALRESLELGCPYVGTEHLLLGLVREGEGTGASILVALGLNPGDVRAKVTELLGGFEKTGKPGTPAPLADAETDRVRAAFLSLHRETCDRCALLGILCDGCREAVGECPALSVIQRAMGNQPLREVPADDH